MIAHKISHSFTKKNMRKSVGLKVDMFKAYVELNVILFQKYQTRAFRFHESFIRIIRGCVEFVTYSILLN